jgi:lipopolysaccharide transport system ATP-binding protein
MSDELAIVADGLGKRYRIGAGGQRHDSLRDMIVDRAASIARRKAMTVASSEEFFALKDATFRVAHGENVGIIGLNGAGKSTLLKILSRITEPTTGTARINGRLGALLEVGTGFHQELTGRENVFLYGAILGMSKREIAQKFDAIVEFAEILKFIDTPVKRYSSGMYVRLAFAVAAHLKPEVLLLDEVLAVGDLSFQRKCMEFTQALRRENATILFVSHNMFSIKSMCTRVIYLKQGTIQFDGATDEGIRLYQDDCKLSANYWENSNPIDRPILITDVSIRNQNEQEKTVFSYGEQMTLRMAYSARQLIDSPNFIIAFIRSDGVACCNFSSEADGAFIDPVKGIGVIQLRTPPIRLVADVYSISIIVRKKGFQEVLCAQNGGTFHVRHELFDTHFGVFHEPGNWKWRTDLSPDLGVNSKLG